MSNKWKHPATNSAIPTWTSIKTDIDRPRIMFKANPLKHWRKQLTYSEYRNFSKKSGSAVGMLDTPGYTNYQADKCASYRGDVSGQMLLSTRDNIDHVITTNCNKRNTSGNEYYYDSKAYMNKRFNKKCGRPIDQYTYHSGNNCCKHVTYKPIGATSSSTRIERLKLNVATKSGNNYTSNTYAPYNIKSKTNKFTNTCSKRLPTAPFAPNVLL